MPSQKMIIKRLATILALGGALLFTSYIVVKALPATQTTETEPNSSIDSAPLSAQSADRYPPETQFSAIPQGNLNEPAYFDSVADERFRTRITKITDKATFNQIGHDYGYGDDYHPVQPYPKNQAWNSNGTYIRIGNTLLDGQTYQFVKDIEGHIFERKWSYTNPFYIYGLSYDDNNFYFVRQDVRTPAYANVVTLRSFSRNTYDAVYMGPWEGNISFDDRLVALSALKNNDLIIILYNIQTNTILAEKTFPNIWGKLDWVSISPLGNYVLMNWKADPENTDPDFRYSIDQYDLSLNHVRTLANQGQHGDMGVDENGNEVYVQFEFGARRGIWSYRLDNGSELKLLPDKYSGGHVSCRNYNRPGWCYLTTAADGYKEVFALKLDGSGTVNRFGQTYIASGEGAQGNPNPDGTKIAFKSDWGDANAELDVFVVEKTLPAFPGAQGGGAAAKGGRGGRVIEVTNLNDSGAGSLRAALEATGPRTVVFKVGGTITLESPIRLDSAEHSFLTVAGQTAPGGGILLRASANMPDQQSLIYITNSHDIIIRYLRFRTGSNATHADNLSFGDGAHNIIVDHSSFSWASDENIAIWSEASPAYNITLSSNIIAEGSAGHSCGAIFGTNTNADDMQNIAIHHNFFAHNNNRNPLLKISSADLANNLIYGWGWWATGIAGGIDVDIIGNKYVFQDAVGGTHRRDIFWRPNDGTPNTGVGGTPSIYFSGNLGSRLNDPSPNSWDAMLEKTGQDWGWPDEDGDGDTEQTPIPSAYQRNTPHDLEFTLEINDASELESLLLDGFGAGASARLDENGDWIANRDTVDTRIISEYNNDTGDIPASENDVGGYPNIASGTAYTDTDHDGMPDSWEDTYGLNKNDAGDAILDNDNDGYTNLEEFLNGTLPACASLVNDNFAGAIDISIGDTKEPNTCGATTANDDPIVSDCGLGQGQATVWYRYEPPQDTAVSINTEDASYDTFIAVWEGNAIDDLNPIACNDDAGDTKQSAVAFQVQGGLTYYIEVGQP